MINTDLGCAFCPETAALIFNGYSVCHEHAQAGRMVLAKANPITEDSAFFIAMRYEARRRQ